MIPTGLAGSEEALQRALSGSLASLGLGTEDALRILSQGGNATLGNINTGMTNATAKISPFTTTGTNANNLMAALSGASGNPAQSAAFADFQTSPLVQFLQQQGEQGVLRNASALGGLGGGGIQKDLMRFNQGLASTELDKTFGRLDTLANRGFTGAQTEADLIDRATGRSSNLLGDFAKTGAGLRQNEGQVGSSLISNFGANQAAGRTRAGENIAGGISDTTSALAALREKQGTGVSEILDKATGNISNLLAGLGQGNQASQQALAELLANLSTGASSNVSSLPGIPGTQQNEGILGGLGALSGGLGTLLGAI